MNRRRGCLWGIFQVSFVLCVTSGVILSALSQAVLQERVTPSQIWRRLVDTPKDIRVVNGGMTGDTQVLVDTPVTMIAAQANMAITATPFSTITAPTVSDTLDDRETVTSTVLVQTPVPTANTLAMLSPTPKPTATALTLRILPAPTETPTPFVDEMIDPTTVHLRIPKIGVNAPIVLAPIVDGYWQVSHLAQTVSHLERTANPGDRGNVVLTAAESNGDGTAPFAHLGTLTPGDLVLVYYQGQVFHYQIDYLATVSAADVAVTYPSREPKITLITHSSNERMMAVGVLAPEKIK